MIRSVHHRNTSNGLGDLFQSSVRPERVPVNLVFKLCQALAQEDIAYCHWKSNNALDRSARGDNDLDLLVSRAHMPRFTGILCRLGFKQARAPAEKQMPGVVDYYGYDGEADRWIHVHAHYQLVLGHDMTKNYRLPIERSYLESATKGDLFKVPAPEFEFIVFVIRMVMKHSTWDLVLARQGGLNSSERQELAYLEARIKMVRVYEILQQHLPYVNVDLFDNCIEALRPDSGRWSRVKTGRELQSTLRANARRPLPIDTHLKLWRRAALTIRRRIFKSSSKYRLESGGAIIAIIGGDGAGKSTAVDALYTWLSKNFETTTAHMGKPGWSRTTFAVRAILKIGNVLGLYPLESSLRETVTQKSTVTPRYPWLVREACRARDRYWTYVKARRFAARGGLVIVDRFPLPQIRLMDGPLTEQVFSAYRNGRLAGRLMSLEQGYYRQFASPEVLVVLRVDPEIAVRRKTDEDATSVRQRSKEIWDLSWEHTDAHIIDASKSKAEVLTELKALVWSEL